MRVLYLSVVLFALLICASCGSSSGTVTGFIPKGNFSNASLNGQYVYQIEGFDLHNNGMSYREAGVFTANGNGGITKVTDDFSEGGNVFSTTSTGAYFLNHDGSGTLTFSNSLTTVNFEVTLISASKVYLIELDSTLNAGGLAEKQDPAAIAAVPNGTFVFREHDINLVQSIGSVGAFTVSGGVVRAGSEDVNRGGVLTSLTFTAGSFNAPDPTTGRNSGSLTDSSLATSSFFYYIVDAANIRFLATTSGITGSGRAELQNGTPALSGSYAFGSSGDTLSSLVGVNTVGRFTAGGGNITAGALDSVQVVNNTTNNATNVSFTGTFTPPVANGRAVISLTTATDSHLLVWMVSPSRGFFLVNDPTTVQEGTLDLQQSSTFSNATMNGQYALVMDGFDGVNGVLKDRVGTLLWDGSGNLSLNEITNTSGSASGPFVLSGSYSVSSNGRTTGSISTLSSNLVFYLVSGNHAYVIQNDSGVVINGTISKQN
jgi:hypothetical protein